MSHSLSVYNIQLSSCYDYIFLFKRHIKGTMRGNSHDKISNSTCVVWNILKMALGEWPWVVSLKGKPLVLAQTVLDRITMS